MTNLRRVGAAGAFLQTAYFIILLLFLLVLMPAQGFEMTADNMHNGGIALTFAARSPLRALDDARDIVLAVGALLAAVAAFEMWGDRMRWIMRLALASGIAACGLLLASGMTGFTAIPLLVEQYQAGNVADASGAYLAVTLVTGGVRLAGLFAYGAWALLVSWRGLGAGPVPRGQAVLGVFTGVALMLSGLIGGPVSLVALLCALVWTPWLGGWLLAGKGESIRSMPL